MICALAIRTGIPVSVLDKEEEDVILTMIDLLSAKSERREEL